MEYQFNRSKSFERNAAFGYGYKTTDLDYMDQGKRLLWKDRKSFKQRPNSFNRNSTTS